MKSKWNAAIALVLILSIIAGCAFCEAQEATNDAGDRPALVSEYWTENSEAAASLNDYLTAVTDEASPDYIPVRDRVAVFDLDGTLMCETYPFCFEYMVLADDEVREYGDAESADQKKADYRAQGIGTISMRDDWKTIYGENVIKTDAPDGPEADAPTSGNPTPATEDIQYVLYLGTNDKDTNKPVFTQAEAMERAKEILIRHFGGYTIQEAHGGWVDEGQLYQEYTLVIYLSDTTPEAVHAAADELIETFRQSSVLIHANPTVTEFYSGAK